MLSVHSPRKEVRGNRVRFSCTVDSGKGTRSLWFSVPSAFRDAIDSDMLDAFVIGLLFEASQTGQDIEVRGNLSEKLYYSFSNGYAYLLSRLTETGRPIKLIPSGLGRAIAGSSEHHVAAGFSAGIDSFQAFITHNIDRPIDGYRISRFIMNNVGSHGAAGSAAGVFARRRANVTRFAEEMGIDLIDIDSNLDEFFLNTPFQLTHTLRNVAAATIFQGYFGKFLYSSSFKYDECHVGPTYDMGYSEPYALHLLSTDQMACISTGCEFSRLEKTVNIAGYEPTCRYLDICIDPTNAGDRMNCSRCWKCCRALLTFEALGMLERYEGVFDLAAFKAHRDRYMATTLRDMSKRNPNDADVVSFTRDRLANPPSMARVIALRSRQKFASLRR